MRRVVDVGVWYRMRNSVGIKAIVTAGLGSARRRGFLYGRVVESGMRRMMKTAQNMVR